LALLHLGVIQYIQYMQWPVSWHGQTNSKSNLVCPQRSDPDPKWFEIRIIA
jgi:hypothetical protein